MSEFLLSEAHLDLLLLTDLGQISLWGIGSLVLNIALIVLIVSCRGRLCLLCNFIDFGLIRIFILGGLSGFSRNFLDHRLLGWDSLDVSLPKNVLRALLLVLFCLF